MHPPQHTRLCSSLLVMTSPCKVNYKPLHCYEYKDQGPVTEPIEGCQNSPPASHLGARNFGEVLSAIPGAL